MSEQKFALRGPTLLAGKIVSNFGQSSIDCIIRRMTENGATLSVDNIVGVPEQFSLLIPGAGPPRPCKRAWQSDRQIGIVFEAVEIKESEAPLQPQQPERRPGESMVRGQMLALRAALDEIETGVVLLDADLNSQYINRAFRRMWALPDAVAERNPSYRALMSHGRDTGAYEIRDPELDAYVEQRVRSIIEGDPRPLDVRHTSGAVIRVQCAVLPNGGRMLSYTYVTDIVRHADELEVLRAALDNVEDGIVLLDPQLNARFLNRRVREFWPISDEELRARPSFEALVAYYLRQRGLDIESTEGKSIIASRVAALRDGREHTRDLRMPDGRTLRELCTALENGGRMLRYCDITDLVKTAQHLERLATTDSLTGLYNRRHFMTMAEAEWSRFMRYWRPISMLMLDIDHFKQINDRYGHAVGDEAIVAIAKACLNGKRKSDIVGRLGGEEFAILLPETDASQATIVAERLCRAISQQVLQLPDAQFSVTASIGVACASVDMTHVEELMKIADQALYQAKADGRNRVVRWTGKFGE